jgi:hypothetical protein
VAGDLLRTARSDLPETEFYVGERRSRAFRLRVLLFALGLYFVERKIVERSVRLDLEIAQDVGS